LIFSILYRGEWEKMRRNEAGYRTYVAGAEEAGIGRAE
jgi:hypothetical protein